MTRSSRSISEVDLHAYVDGQLDADRSREVEAFLLRNPDTAAEVSRYRAINAGLHDLFDPVLEEPIPERLLAARQPARGHRGRWLQAAAMLATLVVGTTIGWIARDELRPAPRVAHVPFVDHAFTAHVVYTPEVRHPVEVAAKEEKHLVGWLSKRLGTRIQAPRLSQLGYELLGGRLLASEGEPAAQFMYQNEAGKRLTLFIRHRREGEKETAFRFARRNGTQGFYWVDGELGYALIGDIDRPQIARAAHIVYEELND